jgi:two-component sensor histidine kinase
MTAVPKRTDVDLDSYMLALADDLAEVLADASRTLLVNVDPIVVPEPTAESIGAIVRELVGALAWVSGPSGGTIQVSCGTNRNGSLTLVVDDEGSTGNENLGSKRIASLVSHFGTRMVIETDAGLRCTVAVPAQFTV